jgi:hypothetical protein
MSVALSPKQRVTASKIAGLTIVNALIFQEVLASHNARVHPLAKSLSSPNLSTALADHWKLILEDIDYYPIFSVARDLVLGLTANAGIDASLRSLADRALEIVKRRAALRHDLMGRVYHRLLEDAKYLGTFYTSVPAATLLLKLALAPGLWKLDWTDLEQISALRVGDLACGTGTLLMAAAEAISDNYVASCANKGLALDLGKLHKLLMEEVIFGYDVLPSALHLTASTLALRASAVSFADTHLYSVPLGGPKKRLGSIEFLGSTPPRQIVDILDLFGVPSTTPTGASQVTGRGDVSPRIAPLPDLDLCVMNPPFTRSVGGNRLFGSLPNAEVAPMQKKLKELVAENHALASITAGLGSVFVATGDQALKDHGRMALVLPKALLSGVAWNVTRQLLAQHYQLEYVIASHDPERWNFSDNTELSEILLVAQKLPGGADAKSHQVACINLWRNPMTAFEAMSIAHALIGKQPPDVEHGQGSIEVEIGGMKAGEAVSVPWASMRTTMWMFPCAFGQSDLVRAAFWLIGGSLYVPGSGVVGHVPLKALADLGHLGPDRRDIHDGFRLASGKTAYPAYWGHDATRCKTLSQAPNAYLTPLAKAKTGRHLRKATDLWPRAGNLILAERMWLKTQRLTAVHVTERVLSNVWWPFALHKNDERAEKALALWLNSTLGMLLLFAHREETRGAWVAFKKPVLEAIPTLDVNGLNAQAARHPGQWF